MKLHNIVFIFSVLITCLLTGNIVFAQCDLKRYNELIKEGDGYMTRVEPDYQQAMYAYSAAMTACKDKMPEVQKKIIDIFDKINKLKTKAENAEKNATREKEKADSARIVAESEKSKAETEKQHAQREQTRADSALKIANKLLATLDFYDNKIAIAIRSEGYNYSYGFIDRHGNTVIDFKYDAATPFNSITGFARVSRLGKDFLIDTTGKKEYRLCEDIKLLYGYNNFEALDLDFKHLKVIPEKVFQKNRFSILLLAVNLLKQIPANISMCSDNLFFLDLSENKITSLSTEIGKLQKLTKLYLRVNQIDAIPKEIGNLINLTELDLSNNKITLLPSEIGKLQKLTMLDLDNNQIDSIPREIGNLNNLTRLDLDNNKITFLPSEIGKLQKLTQLYLYNNQLDSIPKEIGNLNNLMILNLVDNKITFLPTEIVNLKNLKWLYLNGRWFNETEKQHIQQWLPNCNIYW
jgi:Leucine-rich repeat (LRR) protein